MKYIGSKQRLSKQLVPIIQSYITDKTVSYIEPFVGGANVIDKVKHDNKIGFDYDELPIDIFNNYKDKNIGEQLPERLEKEHYYDVRDNEDKYDSTYRAGVLLFGSYNARVYGGCWGGYSETKSGFRNYFQEARRNLEKQLPNLANITFEVNDFFEWAPIQALSTEHSVIYCDPPYSKGIGYKDEFDHERFWDLIRDLSVNHTVLVSEYSAPQDFTVLWEQDIKSHMNNRGKIKTTEKLFTLTK